MSFLAEDQMYLATQELVEDDTGCFFSSWLRDTLTYSVPTRVKIGGSPSLHTIIVIRIIFRHYP